MKGLFITFEGIDGCGKSTQAARVADGLEAAGRTVLRLREPGGNALSEKIRGLLLDPDNAQMCDQTELLLYEAARAQLVCQVIRPALDRGEVVVCDRFFDSTYAYQSGGRGIDEDVVHLANRLGSCGLTPDLTLVMDLDPQVAYGRATAGGADRLEAEGLRFQERVRAAYLRLAADEAGRVRLVDATGDVDQVYDRVCQALASVLPEMG